MALVMLACDRMMHLPIILGALVLGELHGLFNSGRLRLWMGGEVCLSLILQYYSYLCGRIRMADKMGFFILHNTNYGQNDIRGLGRA